MPDECNPHAVSPHVEVLDTFVAGIREVASPTALDRLRAGLAVLVRPRARSRSGSHLEVLTMDGLPLGMIPSEDSAALAEAVAQQRPVEARISAIVPSPQRTRVHLRIAVTVT